MWNGTRLSNTTTPVYLGIHLDLTLCYKTHIEKTKMKVNARNNIIRKLANSKWGCKASTLRPSCLALCYSAAEYACPVWARSTHARKLNPALHDCCRIISGCLKPTNLDSVHLLAGIAPPHIRRTVACRMERIRQTTDDRHQLFHHQPAASRLKSRKSFMRTVTPLDSSASSSRQQLWKDSLTDVPSSVKMGLEVAESLPAGSGEDWLCWRAINRLRTGVGHAKTMMRRWGYLDDAQSVDCDCGEPQTMAHLLSCRLLGEACTAEDLAPQVGEHCVKDTKEEEECLECPSLDRVTRPVSSTVVQQFVRSCVSQFCRCVLPSGSLSWLPQHSCCWLIVFGGSAPTGRFPLPLPLVGGCPCCRWLFRSGGPHTWLYTCWCWIASATVHSRGT